MAPREIEDEGLEGKDTVMPSRGRTFKSAFQYPPYSLEGTRNVSREHFGIYGGNQNQYLKRGRDGCTCIIHSGKPSTSSAGNRNEKVHSANKMKPNPCRGEMCMLGP